LQGDKSSVASLAIQWGLVAAIPLLFFVGNILIYDKSEIS
jgi:hypothetical protein